MFGSVGLLIFRFELGKEKGGFELVRERMCESTKVSGKCRMGVRKAEDANIYRNRKPGNVNP